MARAFDDHYDAHRAWGACSRSGILEALNRTPKAGERFVVTKGFTVGIFEDCASAFVIGLHWDSELGPMVWCSSEKVAEDFFKDQLEQGEVQTCEIVERYIPGRMINPVKKHEWKTVSA
ncbi:hypothetical protein AAF712_005643 [Marasmius tenuissimus]|uniref:YCII-related domain-containing protein n=1 Tax=Marasmius tenuissimus TaxID=585030 RepID=A0ABR3A210_9AGAR